MLGGAAAAWPLAARGQQPAKLPTVGFIGSNASAWSPWTANFVQRLRALGWIEGRTIVIGVSTQADPRDMKFISYDEAKALGLIRPRRAF